MAFQLVEYHTGMRIRLASDEERKEFESSKKSGKPYMMIGYHGYVLKAVVEDDGCTNNRRT